MAEAYEFFPEHNIKCYWNQLRSCECDNVLVKVQA